MTQDARPPQAAGTPGEFAHTTTIRATRDALWQVWTDVAGWPRWDTPLKQATLGDEPMHLGSAGTLTDQGGRSSRFTVTEWVPMESYAFQTVLPGAALTVRRFVVAEHAGGRLELTHHVQFSGPLRWLWATLLGRTFRRQLPPVMDHLKYLVEGI